MPSQSPRDPGIAERVSRVEESVERLHSDVQGIVRSLDQLSLRLSESSKTPWTALASWAGVVLLVVGGLAQGYVRDQGRLEVDLRQLQHRATDHIEKSGHPALEAEVQALRTAFEKAEGTLDNRLAELDDKLQKEDAGHKKELEALLGAVDEKIQIEIGAAHDRLAERTKAIERVIFHPR